MSFWHSHISLQSPKIGWNSCQLSFSLSLFLSLSFCSIHERHFSRKAGIGINNIDISRKLDLTEVHRRLRGDLSSKKDAAKVPWEMQFHDVKEGSTGFDANHPLNGRLAILEQFARTIEPMKNSIGEIISARFPRIILRGIESLDNSPRWWFLRSRGALQNGKRADRFQGNFISALVLSSLVSLPSTPFNQDFWGGGLELK